MLLILIAVCPTHMAIIFSALEGMGMKHIFMRNAEPNLPKYPKETHEVRNSRR